MLAGKAQVSWLRLRNLAPSTEEKPGAGDAASRRGRAAPWSVLPAPPSRPFPAASQHLGLLRAGIPSMESLSPLRAPAAPLCPRELGIRSGNEAQAELSDPVLVFYPRHKPAWAARNPIPGEKISAHPHSHLQRLPPSIPAPSLCSFPGFSPQTCRIHPPALALCPRRARGFWDHPDPAGILRNAPGAGKGAPRRPR